jgi:soluble lytic murein transglycosylase
VHDVVERIAARFGLDPNFSYGVMHAESALDPTVTSIAGARGLMQIMPSEAGRIHRAVFDNDAHHADDLYVAPYNAALGTAELGEKLKLLDGLLARDSMPAVIASYNGGEEAVRRWRTAWDAPPDPDLFSEAIGYTETRRYVRSVLGHVMAYRWVYGDAE